MTKTNKQFALFVLLFSTVLPCVAWQSAHTRKSNCLSQKKQSLAQLKNNSNRIVHKFQSSALKTNSNHFTKEKNKFCSSNIPLVLANNTQYFAFSFKYSKYNVFGHKSTNFITTAHQNSAVSINVGTELLHTTKVMLNVKGHKKWVNLTITKIGELDPKIAILSSVKYEIDATGTQISAKVALNRTYWTRSHNGKQSRKVTDQYGIFDVYNANNVIVKGARSDWAAICIGIGFGVITAITTVLLIGAALYRRSTNIAIDAAAKAASEEAPALAGIDQEIASKTLKESEEGDITLLTSSQEDRGDIADSPEQEHRTLEVELRRLQIQHKVLNVRVHELNFEIATQSQKAEEIVRKSAQDIKDAETDCLVQETKVKATASKERQPYEIEKKKIKEAIAEEAKLKQSIDSKQRQIKDVKSKKKSLDTKHFNYKVANYQLATEFAMNELDLARAEGELLVIRNAGD